MQKLLTHFQELTLLTSKRAAGSEVNWGTADEGLKGGGGGIESPSNKDLET